MTHNPYKLVRLGLKNLFCHLAMGGLLIEFCNDCGRKQPLTWWAEQDMWLLLNKKMGGALCPECFDARAMKRHIMLRWKPELHPVHNKCGENEIVRAMLLKDIFMRGKR